MVLTGEMKELGEKPVPVPLCPPQTPHGLTQVQTRASMVRGWRLTASAMAQPRSILSYCVYFEKQNVIKMTNLLDIHRLSIFD
jgi:hypothetical protein